VVVEGMVGLVGLVVVVWVGVDGVKESQVRLAIG
jgi:hypothetical protein